jgi:recombination protein RecR
MSALSDLIDLFAKLPGLGPRSARRLSLFLLKNKDKLIPNFIETLNDLKMSLVFCSKCGNVDSTSPCKICLSNERIKEKVCVIEEIGDLWVIEKSKAYRGQYHVLGGVLSAIDGVGPEDLNLSSLFQRIKAGEIKELIIATNATMEGQITAQYIADACNNKNVLVTRLAQGMPIGGELDSLDLNTLSAAFTSRSEMKSS